MMRWFGRAVKEWSPLGALVSTVGEALLSVAGEAIACR